MSKLNTKSTGARTVSETKTTNLAGGSAYGESAKAELASILLTSKLEDGFYRSAKDTETRLLELIEGLDPEFVAKAALYARREFGLRSTTHVVAAKLAKRISGKEWGSRFYKNIVVRPDDVTEIMAYYLENCKDTDGKAKITNAMRKGLGGRIHNMSGYDLAKYRSSSKNVKMIDAINLLNPSFTDPIKQLVKGELVPAETWEVLLSEAGKAADPVAAKKAAWKKLISENKLGYLATLRNCVNVLEVSDNGNDRELISQFCSILTNEEAITKVGIFPYQFFAAFNEVRDLPGASEIIDALDKAAIISAKNVPALEGKTVIAFDISGSMHSPSAGKSKLSCIDVAAAMAAMFLIKNNADIIKFGTNAKLFNKQSSSFFGLISDLRKDEGLGFGTNFDRIFEVMNKSKIKYDRLFVISDMQSWMHSGTRALVNSYKTNVNSKLKYYSMDVAGLGTLQFPEKDVFLLAGFSDKTLSLLTEMENGLDKQALVHKIESVVL